MGARRLDEERIDILLLGRKRFREVSAPFSKLSSTRFQAPQSFRGNLRGAGLNAARFEEGRRLPHGPRPSGKLCSGQVGGSAAQTPKGADRRPDREPKHEEGEQGRGRRFRPVVDLGETPGCKTRVLWIVGGVRFRCVEEGKIGIVVSSPASGCLFLVPLGEKCEAGVTDSCFRGDDNPVSREVEAAPEVEAITEGPEHRVDAADGVPGLGPNEGTGGSRCEDITRGVVLALVDFSRADAFQTTGAPCSVNAEFQKLSAVHAHLFSADEADGASTVRDFPEGAQA